MTEFICNVFFFFSSRRRHTRYWRDWSSDVCSSDLHRRIAGATEVADLALLRDELEDRFGPPPDPLVNLISLQQARIKLGQARAQAVTFKAGRHAVTPVELDSVRAKRLRDEVPGALYESGKSQFSVRVPDEPEQRFPAVIRAADALLAVTREAA